MGDRARGHRGRAGLRTDTVLDVHARNQDPAVLAAATRCADLSTRATDSLRGR